MNSNYPISAKSVLKTTGEILQYGTEFTCDGRNNPHYTNTGLTANYEFCTQPCLTFKM